MPKKVLLVDDDALARGFFRTLLTAEGYTVLEAGDGTEAVRLFRQGGVDLLVTDIYMPRMNGLDAIVEMDPKAQGVPVIALSGGRTGSGSDPLDLAESLGVSRTFHKPLDYKAFMAAVKELIAEKK
jgi:two-component system chemotaxis response regulator CheY